MIIYLRNALGFFIQCYHCALMIFLPFSPEAYRFRRKYIFFWITVIAAVLAALFAAGLYLRDSGENLLDTFHPNQLILAAILLVLANYVWMVQETVLKKLLAFDIVLFYAVSQYYLVNLFLPLLPWSTELEGLV